VSAPRFAILGTAGHIDHGKTALVRLLTGVDTDRLKEEKARGISIDLGFAHLDLEGGVSCGIVDVPGHERFVKNMLAGAGGIDAVLLVIAADEGIMPQTREHLDIIRLLGVERGVVALTKIDMVDEEWRALVAESVAEDLAARGYAAFPIVPVSSRTGEGRETLLAALSGAMQDLQERPSGSVARLPVDRAFVIEGFGTVVTGTLWSGTIRPGDQLVVEPGGRPARVRNVEVHGEKAAAARAGQRTALALAGLDRTEAPRGSWVTAPGAFPPSHMLDVRLRALPDAARDIVHRQRVRFHLGASEVLGRVVLLEGNTLAPGAEAFAQLRLEEPVPAARGDRFVLRFYSPARAIAGGTVLVPGASKHPRTDPRTVEALHIEATGSAADRVAAALAALPAGGTADGLARATGISSESVARVLEELAAARRAVPVSEGGFVEMSVLRRWETRLLEVLEAIQVERPFRWGTGRGELRSRLGKEMTAPLFEGLTAGLLGTGSIHARGDLLRAGSEEHALGAAAGFLVDRLARRLEEAGGSPPGLKELITELGQDVREALEYLTFQGVAAKVTPEIFLHKGALERIRTWIEATLARGETLAVADLRDAFSMSRKYSVPVLELFDKQGVTKRIGDVRGPGRRFSK
jgi:selenocysteine-specific elongation factor